MLHRIPKLRQKYLNISVKRKGLRQLYAITPQHIRIRSPLKDYRDGSLCPVGYCLRTNTLYGDVFDINLFYRMVRRELVYLIVNFTGSLDSPLEGDGFELLVPRHESPRFPKVETLVVMRAVGEDGHLVEYPASQRALSAM